MFGPDMHSHTHPWMLSQISRYSVPELIAVYKDISTTMAFAYVPYYMMIRYRQTANLIEEYVERIGGSLTGVLLERSPMALAQDAVPDIIVQAPQQQVVRVQAPPPAPRVIHVPSPQPQVIIETVDHLGRVISRAPAPETPGSTTAIPSLPMIENGSANEVRASESENDRKYREWKERQGKLCYIIRPYSALSAFRIVP
ncbi:uncharacterized protein K460DRAFT_352879 [Cucurbitaria berberidis CBS 394.84]|uniref:Uncharacterized protein n=1 Tax=Cucurbitaria berberidis CBS 394.84 TaxID=1168544 RepID=A0A9P4GLT3_9PLEO|nr:uncharacterized protein K460DRAFT_352879 [Cucurbitaria berberidis CBS 394.84]KAF1847799.1 hypothetical protein K460DRAFT_352879 [Cucurbitaria berberidis CBS 394.84]